MSTPHDEHYTPHGCGGTCCMSLEYLVGEILWLAENDSRYGEQGKEMAWALLDEVGK